MPLANTNPGARAVSGLPGIAAWNVALQHISRSVDALDGRPVQALAIPAHASPADESAAAAHNGTLVGQIASAAPRSGGAALPATATSSASSDSVQAVRVLQEAKYADVWTQRNAQSAIGKLAEAGGKLSTAPTQDAIAAARQLLVSAAQDYLLE